MSIIKHIALTGSSNNNILFADKFKFLQRNLILDYMSYFILISSHQKFSITILSRIIFEKSVIGEFSAGRRIFE